MRKRSRLFEELISRSWWTILFFLVCFFAYDQAVKRRNREEEKLRIKLNELKCDKERELAQQEELKREILSQNDETWIELTLMKRLGLVPEGQTKVHFIQK